VHIPEIIDKADFGEMVRDGETLSSVVDSASPKSINLPKIFKMFSTTVKTCTW
jgi:hypothetical protein